MSDYDELIQALRDEGRDQDAEILEKYSATQLRQKAKRADELEADVERLKKENFELVVVPKKEEAFRRAGVDFDSLRPAEQEILKNLQFEGDAPSEQWVADQISKYQLPVAGGGANEQSNAAGVVSAARSAPTGGARGGGAQGVLDGEEVASWTMEKRIKFMNEHPDEYEALLRGEEVTGVAVPT